MLNSINACIDSALLWYVFFGHSVTFSLECVRVEFYTLRLIEQTNVPVVVSADWPLYSLCSGHLVVSSSLVVNVVRGGRVIVSCL